MIKNHTQGIISHINTLARILHDLFSVYNIKIPITSSLKQNIVFSWKLPWSMWQP